MVEYNFQKSENFETLTTSEFVFTEKTIDSCFLKLVPDQWKRN